MSDTGTFLIADISGYTEYLAQSDLDHGPALATDLITRIVETMQPRFAVNKIEGDAVFALSTITRTEGLDILDIVDEIYNAFLRRLMSVGQATSCGCSACGLLPRLDLKLIAHVGSFDRQRIAGRTELVGREVIVAHRLLKNSLGFAGPGSGYVLLTDACVTHYEIDPQVEGLAPHSEVYPHLGEILTWVSNLKRRVDLRPAWQTTAALVHETRMVLRAEPADIWNALAPGRSDSCVTDRLSSIHEVIEWKPYERLVVEVKAPDAKLFHEMVLAPETEGTAATIRWFRGRRQPKAPSWAEIGTRLDSITTAALGDARARLQTAD